MAQVESYVQAAQALPNRPTLLVCEVGFNCGHSTATFLESNPAIKTLSFDWQNPISSKHYGLRARSFFRSRYGSRFKVVDGDSKASIPKYLTSHPGTT
eukprot:2124593-Prymnesium_polylepis.1